jgi:malate synthase A
MTKRVEIQGAPNGEVLSPDALAFLYELMAPALTRIESILSARVEAQAAYDRGELPSFSATTRDIREGDWLVAPIPRDLEDRRVEITGPVDRKMIINALNSGASVFMADFEDSSSPTWANCIDGQANLRDAVAGTIRFTAESGKVYEVGDRPATLMVRPRGWHLFEKHATVNGRYAPAGIFDFGLYFFHNAKALIAKGTAPYFYLPKMQSHLEARLWNEVFVRAQELLGVPKGTIRATVLIETLPAAFQMDEILFELRDHSAGLNCGRWDYIFSFIKTVRAHGSYVMPDRAQIGMTQPCMRAYSELLVQTCHRRNIHAMGGMAAQIPIKNDPAANEAALEKVRQDKLREVRAGHDGTWVAHPALVPIAKAIFDAEMPKANQIGSRRAVRPITREMLLELPTGTRTEAGLRQNISVGVQYLEAWLRGSGCVPLNDLMEDAATAEISRTQIWQWIAHGSKLEDGRTVTRELVERILDEEIGRLGERGAIREARRIFETVATEPRLADFLTVPAYDTLVGDGHRGV